MTLRTVLLSIQALLSAAEPDDPQDAVVAQQYKRDMKLYAKTAAHWSAAYAGAPKGAGWAEEQALLAQVMEMGFGEAQARHALSSKDWNVERAVASSGVLAPTAAVDDAPPACACMHGRIDRHSVPTLLPKKATSWCGSP